MSDISHADRRKKRVKRLKRMIVASFFLLLTIPTALCILLVCRLHTMSNELMEMTAQYEAQLQITDDMQNLLDDEKSNGRDEKSAKDATGTDGDAEDEILDEATLKADEPRKVYLTFDDGPSIYTEQILDILDTYGVKATFFVTGAQAEEHPEWYREIVERGHTLGMHTYSHVYSDIYKSKANFIRDFTKLRSYVKETTGVDPKYYRFPGGSSNTVSGTDINILCEYVTDQDMVYFDWNVSSGDATNPMPSKDRIIANVTDNVGKHDTAVVLFHDAGDKYSTVQALPTIIERIQAMDNTVILPITEETEPVQHKKVNTSEED